MRRFICASCGKTIELNWCSGQRGKDLHCPECGGRVHRDGAGAARGRRFEDARIAVDAAGASGDGSIISAGDNTFRYGRKFAGRGLPFNCRRGGRGIGRGAV